MKENEASVRGRILREAIARLTSTQVLGKKIKSGELRKNVVEPLWKCPEGYLMEIVSMANFNMEVTTNCKKPENGRVILQLHGGGYVGAMKNVYRSFSVLYTQAGRGSKVVTPDYRVAPEDPYPAPLEDALEAYHWILAQGYRAEDIVVTGDSAGGGLALALCLYLKDHGEKLPAGIIAMSPWTDLTASGASYADNYEIDPLFGKSHDTLIYNSEYVPENESMTNPYISPLFGDFTGFPPILMQVGSYEMLLSDTLSVAEKAREQGVLVRKTVYPGMFHVFQEALLMMPESRAAWTEVGQFLDIIYKKH